MENNQKQKIMEVIHNNSKWPIILEGVGCDAFKSSVKLSAFIPSQELGLIPNSKGFSAPVWLKELRQKSKRLKRAFLVISDMESLDFTLQEKFYGLLKYRGINGYSFSENVQILIPIKMGTADKISPKIKSLTILYRVN